MAHPSKLIHPRGLAAVSAESLRIEANPDGTRYIVASGAQHDTILVSDRRTLRAHLERLLAANAPSAAEKQVMSDELFHTCLDILTARATSDGDHFDRAQVTGFDLVCEGCDERDWFPLTVTAFNADNQAIDGFAADEYFGDDQYNDLRDVGGDFTPSWTLTLTRPA